MTHPMLIALLLTLAGAFLIGLVMVGIDTVLRTGKPLWLFGILTDERGALSSVIGSSIKTPGAYVKVTLGVGQQSSAAGAKKVVLTGNMTSAGTGLAETVYQITSKDQALELFGAGSELHLMCKYALAAYPAITLYAIGIVESAGANAEGTITVTGTATADGAISVSCLGETVSVSLPSGTTAAQAGVLIETLINQQEEWPITAADDGAGEVTISAKQAGLRGNEIFVLSDGAATGLTITDIAAYLTGGSTSDDPANALDVLTATRYHLIVAPYQDATNLADYKAHIANVSEPLEGKRARFIFGSVASLATTTTIATGLNDARGNCFWHYLGWEPASLVAAVGAAETAEAYERDRAANTDGLYLRGLKPQRLAAAKPNTTELNSALNNGISPIDHDGSLCYLVRNVTTRCQTAGGSPDFAVIDVHYVEVADAVADDIVVNFANVFADFKLDADVEGEVPDPGVATPATIRDFIFSRLKTYAAGGSGPLWLSNVDALAESLVVEMSGVTAGRVDASIPIDPVELLHQGAFDVRQL